MFLTQEQGRALIIAHNDIHRLVDGDYKYFREGVSLAVRDNLSGCEVDVSHLIVRDEWGDGKMSISKFLEMLPFDATVSSGFEGYHFDLRMFCGDVLEYTFVVEGEFCVRFDARTGYEIDVY